LKAAHRQRCGWRKIQAVLWLAKDTGIVPLLFILFRGWEQLGAYRVYYIEFTIPSIQASKATVTAVDPLPL
jgi:hypothetical protein